MKSSSLVPAAAVVLSLLLHYWLFFAPYAPREPAAPAAANREFHMVDAVVLRKPLPLPPAPVIQPKVEEVPPPEVEVQPKPEERGAVVSPQKLPPRQLRPQRATTGPAADTPTAARGYLPFYRVDRRPAFLHRAELAYPVQAKRMNVEGTVIVEADIDETGAIVDVRLVKGAGFGFDDAALAYIRESSYSPATAGGRPVPVRMRFTVRFTLK